MMGRGWTSILMRWTRFTLQDECDLKFPASSLRSHGIATWHAVLRDATLMQHERYFAESPLLHSVTQHSRTSRSD